MESEAEYAASRPEDYVCKHDMPLDWCAICNGDAKKQEQSEKEPEFKGLQKGTR